MRLQKRLESLLEGQRAAQNRGTPDGTVRARMRASLEDFAAAKREGRRTLHQLGDRRCGGSAANRKVRQEYA